MRKRIKFLERELSQLIASPRLKLNKNVLAGIPKVWGLYRIFMPRSERTLYIGKSSNLRRRLRNDLLTLTGSHTLKNKLEHEWQINRENIIPYLNQCRVQIITEDQDNITTLEHFAISMLEPELND
ncbi:MAG: hypothetical protein A2Y81_03610 [Nitrospirae bacterium RBG_13_43_8]|nr:MAG: hypothetical protein A2Y81_03610 [Nitrospirae bacterium RBG_13_43_8]